MANLKNTGGVSGAAKDSDFKVEKECRYRRCPFSANGVLPTAQVLAVLLLVLVLAIRKNFKHTQAGTSS